MLGVAMEYGAMLSSPMGGRAAGLDCGRVSRLQTLASSGYRSSKRKW